MDPNRILTFENDDLLDLKKYCDRLEKFLTIEQDFVDGALVVALTGGFGSGKSTFINMWVSSLQERREKGEFVPMPVVLNAWESDHCGDPLLAILAGLMAVIDAWQGSDAPENKAPLRESAKEAAWFLAGVGNGLLSKATGVDVIKGIETAKKNTPQKKEPIPDVIEIFSKRMEALRGLKQQLTNSLGGKETKVILFVDELDRCRPDYAIAYLEVIKHVFDVSGLVFVLAVDYPHLSNSARTQFGSDLNFEEYFRKFCHRIFDLPVPSEESQLALARSYAQKYLHAAEKRSSLLEVSHGFEQRMKNIFNAFPLKPRQTQEAFRILGFLLQAEEESKIGKLRWAIGAGALLMCYLRVASSKLFFDAKSRDGIIEICRQLRTKLGLRESKWWIHLVLSGSWERSSDGVWMAEILKELGFAESDNSVNMDFLSDFGDGWGGYHKNWIHRLIRTIESADVILTEG